MIVGPMGFSEIAVLHPVLNKPKVAIARIAVTESKFRKMEKRGTCGVSIQN